jgi:hypothetical protein
LVAALQMNTSVVLQGAISTLASSFCHSFDISAGAEGSSCTSKDNRSYISCYLGITKRSDESLQHAIGHGVASFRTIESNSHYSINHFGIDVVGSSIENTVRHIVSS